MKNNLFDEFKEKIMAAKSVAICSHVNPDGDAIGSSFGLAYVLRGLGKKVSLIKNDDFPTNLIFMPDYEQQVSYDNEIFDLFIVTDVASLDRIGDAALILDRAGDSICIDHHRTNDGFANLNIIYPNYSSTCQLLADILIYADIEIGKDAATYLYLGMVTDTNRFLYESSGPDTLRTAAKLLEFGADKPLIHNNLYERLDLNYLLLQAEVIKNSRFMAEGKIILAKQDRDLLDRYGLDFDKTESLVAILKSIDGVELACLVKENEKDLQKVSFRSKTGIDVAALAQEFGGGGHVRAAGCSVKGTNSQVCALMFERMSKLIEEGCFNS
ncbi:DHH family phosphoesterase [Peptoniphilaceae bacterium SGI.131]